MHARARLLRRRVPVARPILQAREYPEANFKSLRTQNVRSVEANVLYAITRRFVMRPRDDYGPPRNTS